MSGKISAASPSVVRRSTTSEQPSSAAKPEATASGRPAQDAYGERDPGHQKLLAASAEEVVLTSNLDDPFARPNSPISISAKDFHLDPASGKPVALEGPNVVVFDEPFVYDWTDAGFIPTATALAQDEQGNLSPVNPWLPAQPDEQGNFTFPAEERFPLHQPMRDEHRKKVVVKIPIEVAPGQTEKLPIKIWLPRDLHVGQNVVFEGANAARNAVESWLGRPLPWGHDGQLPIEPHAFVGLNAFFTPAARGLFFGLVPYKMPGERTVRMFEMATSRDVVLHESGHALHHEGKPNVFPGSEGFGQWGESVGDQVAMWGSLRDPERRKQLLAETGGNLLRSNALSQTGELLSGLQGEGVGIRDAFQQKTVGGTEAEVHERSEVITGAAYKVFQRLYTSLCKELPKKAAFRDAPLEAVQDAALERAGDIMGRMMARTFDFTPENDVSLEDVGKAYLKVDKEYFGGKYGKLWREEFEKRGMFTTPETAKMITEKHSVTVDGKEAQDILESYPAGDQLALFETPTSYEAWLEHEASLPKLALPPSAFAPEAAEALVKQNLDALGIPAGFGLELQKLEVNAEGEAIVRVGLTEGRDDDALPVGNHGILVFRKDGTLADYHSPFPEGLTPTHALSMLAAARKKGMDEGGKPLALVQTGPAYFDVETFQVIGEGINSDIKVGSLMDGDEKMLKITSRAMEGCGYEKQVLASLPAGAELIKG